MSSSPRSRLLSWLIHRIETLPLSLALWVKYLWTELNWSMPVWKNYGLLSPFPLLPNPAFTSLSITHISHNSQ
jgi:hypothetical protein